MQMLIMRLSKLSYWVRPTTYGLTLMAVVGSLLPPRHIEQLTFSLSDKLVHGVYYFLLCLGWLKTYAKGNAKRQYYVVMALLILGLLLECLQALLPIGRVMDAYDLVANGFGIGVGLVVARMWFKVT